MNLSHWFTNLNRNGHGRPPILRHERVLRPNRWISVLYRNNWQGRGKWRPQFEFTNHSVHCTVPGIERRNEQNESKRTIDSWFTLKRKDVRDTDYETLSYKSTQHFAMILKETIKKKNRVMENRINKFKHPLLIKKIESWPSSQVGVSPWCHPQLVSRSN